MSKKPYSTRMEDDAIAAYRSLGEELDVGVSSLMEGLVYWISGDHRRLEDVPLSVRNRIAEAVKNSQDQLADGPSVDGIAELRSRLLAVEKRLELKD